MRLGQLATPTNDLVEWDVSGHDHRTHLSGKSRKNRSGHIVVKLFVTSQNSAKFVRMYADAGAHDVARQATVWISARRSEAVTLRSAVFMPQG